MTGDLDHREIPCGGENGLWYLLPSVGAGVLRYVPDLLSFNLALAACAREREAARALRLLGEMRKAGLLPTSVSYGSALASFQRAGDVDQVQRNSRISRADPCLVYGAVVRRRSLRVDALHYA